MTAELAKAAPAQEQQTNCPTCSKPISKLKRYYRNGKFYCKKKCWQAMLKKAGEEKK